MVLCTIVLCSAVLLFHIQCPLLKEPEAPCPSPLPLIVITKDVPNIAKHTLRTKSPPPPPPSQLPRRTAGKKRNTGGKGASREVEGRRKRERKWKNIDEENYEKRRHRNERGERHLALDSKYEMNLS